jgi:hypothetical protein
LATPLETAIFLTLILAVGAPAVYAVVFLSGYVARRTLPHRDELFDCRGLAPAHDLGDDLPSELELPRTPKRFLARKKGSKIIYRVQKLDRGYAIRPVLKQHIVRRISDVTYQENFEFLREDDLPL